MPDATPDESAGANGTPALSQLYFYLTEGCNLACRHCWLAPRYDPELTATQVLDPELFETAIVEAQPLGLQSIKLTGGEPLLHPAFRSLLDIASRRGVSVSLETNGTLLTPDVAAALSSFGGVTVGVSIDGSDATTHDAIRGVAGSFAAATAAIRLLVDNGIHPQVVFSVMSSNREQVAGVADMAEELGANGVKYNVIQPTGRGETARADDPPLSIADYLTISEFVDRELRPQASIRLHVDVPLAFQPLSYLDSYGGGACGILTILGVLPNGRYALCGIGKHEPKMVFGRVGHDALGSVWARNPVLQLLRDNLPSGLKGICADCLVSDTCSGACIAQNYHRTRDVLAPFWFCESADEQGLFPQSRRHAQGLEDG